MTPPSPDYELTWPPDLFRVELTKLINAPKTPEWDERVELLLEDAFSTSVPGEDFKALPPTPNPFAGGPDSWDRPKPTATPSSRQKFLVSLLRRADSLPLPRQRVPYWSERQTGASVNSLSSTATAREFKRIVRNLLERGYFEKAFEKDCVDDPSDTEPAGVIEEMTGRADLWVMDPTELAEDRNAFCDLIEVLHDLVARPQFRTFHSYSGCGWHHKDFSRDSGQTLYRWRVNNLLDRSQMGLRLAESGEDIGRLVEITDEARGDLISSMTEKPVGPVSDQVRHAIALFRSRGATEEAKRSAAITLALVLEERRKLLKENLLSKDEGALFHIANGFAIRHQNAAQQPDYDPVFRDWTFWLFLATIELTDRLIERGGGSS
ncbi:hypothetical protein ACFVWG_24155 [Kribbella sp. NPDC058245]|uniref:hypothetical protein n=1 Tax=Kribbella sp. NPDC058245 TaxID=3346399 RepID=UPI0036ED6803